MEMDQVEGDWPESTCASVTERRLVPNLTVGWRADLKEEILEEVKERM